MIRNYFSKMHRGSNDGSKMFILVRSDMLNYSDIIVLDLEKLLKPK